MGTILATFDLVTPILPIKFRVNLPFVSGEVQNRFLKWQPWWPSWISDRNVDSYFLCTSHTDTSIKFQVNWPFYSIEDVQNRLSRWQPSWISDHNNFSYFLSTSHPDITYQVSSQLAFLFKRRNSKQIFKMATILDSDPQSDFHPTESPRPAYILMILSRSTSYRHF